MINFYNQVPSVYTHTSRDFQYLSWLINIVLNSVKHNVDDLYDLPNTEGDPRLTELLSMTLGFKVKRKYDQKQLATLVSIIPSILKYKGTIEAVTLACNALIASSGTSGMFDYKLENNCLKVLLPDKLVDTTLFTDLLPYILPAGMTCHIVRRTQRKVPTDPINLSYHDEFRAAWVQDLSWDENKQTVGGLASLYNEVREPDFANLTNSGNVNTGLLSNTLIPVLEHGFDVGSNTEKENTL
jgi:hypothetical protein